MKKILLILLSIILVLIISFYWMKPSEAEIQREAFIQDSISKAIRYEMDNPVSRYTVEESTTIYGGVKFGMSKAEYDKLIPSNSNEIADVNFLFSPSFGDNDEIYSLNISGFDKTANFLDTDIINEVVLLYSVISEKYGEPHISFGKVGFSDLKPGYSSWMHGWDIDDKKIRIGISEDSRGSRYSSVLAIWSDKVEKELQKNRVDKELENIKEESSKF